MATAQNLFKFSPMVVLPVLSSGGQIEFPRVHDIMTPEKRADPPPGFLGVLSAAVSFWRRNDDAGTAQQGECRQKKSS